MTNQDENLKAEYLMIQGQYESFDARAMTIKSWCIPLIAGGLGLGLHQKSIGIEIATTIATSCLWLIEGVWKNFQYCYISRIQLLERHFRNEEIDQPIKPFQVFTSWDGEWQRWFKKRPALIARLKSPFVFLPYLPLIIACLLAIAWIMAST